MRTQKSMDNTVNDLRYKIKLRERQKQLLLSEKLLSFLEQKSILISEKYFFKIPKNLITSEFFGRGRY